MHLFCVLSSNRYGNSTSPYVILYTIHLAREFKKKKMKLTDIHNFCSPDVLLSSYLATEIE